MSPIRNPAVIPQLGEPIWCSNEDLSRGVSGNCGDRVGRQSVLLRESAPSPPANAAHSVVEGPGPDCTVGCTIHRVHGVLRKTIFVRIGRSAQPATLQVDSGKSSVFARHPDFTPRSGNGIDRVFPQTVEFNRLNPAMQNTE